MDRRVGAGQRPAGYRPRPPMQYVHARYPSTLACGSLSEENTTAFPARIVSSIRHAVFWLRRSWTCIVLTSPRCRFPTGRWLTGIAISVYLSARCGGWRMVDAVRCVIVRAAPITFRNIQPRGCLCAEHVPPRGTALLGMRVSRGGCRAVGKSSHGGRAGNGDIHHRC